MATQDEIKRFIQLQKSKLDHERQQVNQVPNKPSVKFNQADTMANVQYQRSDLHQGGYSQSDRSFANENSTNRQIQYATSRNPQQQLHRTNSLWDKLGVDGLTKKENSNKLREIEYKEFVNSNNHGRNSRNVNEQYHQGLSLPLRDQSGAKERLKNERQREYNEFLQQKSRREANNKSQRRSNMSEVIQPQTTYSNPVGYDELLRRKREQEERYR